jgi:hypothetical protein
MLGILQNAPLMFGKTFIKSYQVLFSERWKLGSGHLSYWCSFGLLIRQRRRRLLLDSCASDEEEHCGCEDDEDFYRCC